MSKYGLKIVILLLGILFCISLLQTVVLAEAKDDKKAETTSKILVPDGGFTIVLRAPMSQNRHIVKISKNDKDESIPGFKVSDNIPEFKVSLPKNKPIFFRVDHVNTALYSVEITVEEKSDSGKGFNPFDEFPILKEILEKIDIKVNLINTDPDSANLGSGLNAVALLNTDLNRLLQLPEMQQFYGPNTMKKFQQIQEDAAESAKEKLNLSYGTSKEIRKKSKEVIDILNTIMEKDNSLKQKERDEFSKQILAAFETTANKLEAIENAVWYKNDIQTRILKDEIRYTCTLKSKDSTAKVKSSTYKVIVEGYQTGWMIKGTQGPFINGLLNKSYRLVECMPDDIKTMQDDIKTKRKVEELDMSYGDTVAFSTGALAHLFHSDFKCIGITGGLGLDGNKNTQIALGISFLCHIDEQRLLAFTFGGISGKVKILDGYKDGDMFSGDTLPTKMVNKVGWFGTITYNFNSLFGQNKNNASAKE